MQEHLIPQQGEYTYIDRNASNPTFDNVEDTMLDEMVKKVTVKFYCKRLYFHFILNFHIINNFPLAGTTSKASECTSKATARIYLHKWITET